MFNRKITSKKVLAVSLLFWLVSMGLVGFSSHSGHLLGFEILAMGWLSPLAFNFAWYANVFYLWGLVSVFHGLPTKITPIAAVILSFDTFRYSDHLWNLSGRPDPIYGYGWGAFVWMVSIYLLLIAASIRNSDELYRGQGKARIPVMELSGIVLIVLTVFSTLTLAVYDRVIANENEAKLLSNVAFKRGVVCSVEAPEVSEPITGFSGPLEIRASGKLSHAQFPFKRVKMLLKWGIPGIRIGDQDYYFHPKNDSGLISYDATTPSAAVLELNEIYREHIQARLIDNGTGRVVFDFMWKAEDYPVNTNIYCPAYHSTPAISEQPRLMLTQALGISQVQQTETSEVPGLVIIDGTIVERSPGGLTTKMRYERQKNDGDGGRWEFHPLFNVNCPRDIGWNGDGYDASLDTGWPFKIGEVSHYPGRAVKHKAICMDESVYTYSLHPLKRDYRINIIKRSNQDFEKKWARIVAVEGVPKSRSANYIQAVREEMGKIQIELVDGDTGEILLVETAL